MKEKKARITRTLYEGIQAAGDSNGQCQCWKKASKLLRTLFVDT